MIQFDPAFDRLRHRAVWGAPAIALAVLLPYEVVDGTALFMWDIAGELPPAGWLAALAPVMAAVIVLAARVLTERAVALASAVLSSLAGAAVLVRLGADATAWDAFMLPESMASRPSAGLLALALTAAGSHLTFHDQHRRVGRALLWSAVGTAAVFYLWPGEAEVPIVTVVRALAAISEVPDWRFGMGVVVLAMLALWPAIVAFVGLRHARWPPADDHPVTGILAIYGLPLCLGMFVFRAVATPQSATSDGWPVFGPAGGIVVLAAIVALLASSLEVLARDARTRDALVAPVLGVAAVLATAALQWWLGQPPPKGVDWTLEAPSTAADHFYRELLPAWNRARNLWDVRVRTTSGARAMVEVKRAAREAREASAAIDERLGHAVAAMTRAAHDLDVAGRRWYRLIGDLNDASRAAGLPYYIDPTVVAFSTDDGLRRYFRLRGYRVERVRRFGVDGEQFATLDVRRLGFEPDGRRLLGFSRDLQPFALVDLDEVATWNETAGRGAEADPPTCRPDDGSGRPVHGTFIEFLMGSTSRALDETCGDVLATMRAEHPGRLERLMRDLTERHELQHQIDGPHLAVPTAVHEAVPWGADGLRRRISRELSAYVAAMTSSAVPPALTLVHLSTFATAGPRAAEHHVALIVLARLADRPVTDNEGNVDLTAVRDALDALANTDDDDLRIRAADLWDDLYGRRLSVVEPFADQAPDEQVPPPRAIDPQAP